MTRDICSYAEYCHAEVGVPRGGGVGVGGHSLQRGASYSGVKCPGGGGGATYSGGLFPP